MAKLISYSNRSCLNCLTLAIVCLLAGITAGQGFELSGNLALESRLFPQSPLLSQQYSGGNVAISLQPEFYYAWADGDESVLFTPYLRIDQHDGNRTHFDVRELYWHYVSAIWELSIGLRKVFWGVTESQHLVDILNQTDLVENIDTEDKFGQPMVNLAVIRDWGVLNFYVMPISRERNFLKDEARLRLAVSVDGDAALYESSKEERHVDWAVRWFRTFSRFDIGLSHFSGTTREPLLVPEPRSDGLVLRPLYHTIDQTGLDVQATTGGWLLKLEAIRRAGQGAAFAAAVGGFEYTLANIKNSGIDVGILLEYHYDERGQQATSPFDDDIFVGSRLAFNDVQSTDVLAGAIIDRDTGATFLNIESSRRLGDRYRLEVEVRSFLNASRDALLSGLRKDNYLQVEVARFF